VDRGEAAVRFAALALLLGTAACGGAAADDLADGVLALPAALHEVSGIVAVDERTLACVQDEAGVVFFVDLLGERPLRALPFGPPGDHEGIACAGGELWVLRSDGRLLRLAAAGDRLQVIAGWQLPAAAEYEGLCHDGDRRRLLLLPKGAANGKRRERELRRIFAFDLERLEVVVTPVLTLDLDEIERQAAARGLALPTRTTAKGKERSALRLLGSEIAVVPGSADLLLLSAADHLLARFDAAGNLVATRLFDEVLLPQPEALAFLPDGRLLVASEGKDGAAVVVVVELPR
jgi:hypothetical protein